MRALLCATLPLVFAGCVSTRACKKNTVLIELDYSSAAEVAGEVEIFAGVAGATPQMTPLSRTPGRARDTVEIDFPNNYPAGQTLVVQVIAYQSAAVPVVVGQGLGTIPLDGACVATSLAVGMAVPDAAASDSFASDSSIPPSGPALQSDSSSFDFGSVLIGSTSSQKIFVITNAGTASTLVASVATNPSGAFTLGDSCTGLTLAPGASCAVGATFAPTTPGAIDAVLTVTPSAGTPATVALQGTGVTPGALTPSPSALLLGAVVQGQTGNEMSVTITNTGAQTAGQISTALGGTNNNEFTISHDGCSGQTLAANATCTIGVELTPLASTAAGGKSASLTASALPGGTSVVQLSGTSLTPGTVNLTPPSKDFLIVDVGTTSGAQTFTVSNNGGGTTGTLTASLTGANAGDFILSNDHCSNVALAGAGQCTVDVAFKPSGHGVESAALVISGTPFTSKSASLSGTGRDTLTLTVIKNGGGTGTVTAPATDDTSGSAINCGATCADSFYRTTSNPMVTLTANADATSTFTGWSMAGCSGSTCVVTLSMATMVTASFAINQYTLQINPTSIAGATGTVTGTGGINCGATCMATLNSGTSASITSADPTFQIFKIDCPGSGCVMSTALPTLITMNTNHTVQAIFKPQVNYMFVTSGTYTSGNTAGAINGLGGADAICKAEATAAGLGGIHWTALLGSSQGTAGSRLMVSAGVPARGWIRTDGLAFADDVTSLFGSGKLFYPPRVDATGHDGGIFAGGSGVLTASNSDGSYDTADGSCTDFTSNTGTAIKYGTAHEATHWISGGSGWNCGWAGHLYCFQTDSSNPVTPPAIPGNGRRAFLATGMRLGTSGVSGNVVTDLDNHCHANATAASLPGTYSAFVATNGGPMADSNRFNFTLGPWYRLDGVQVVTAASDFQNGVLPLAAFTLDATGTTYTTSGFLGTGLVSGGTSTNGGATYTCNNWTDTTGVYSLGVGTVDGDDWAETSLLCSTTASIYFICLQQ